MSAQNPHLWPSTYWSQGTPAATLYQHSIASNRNNSSIGKTSKSRRYCRILWSKVGFRRGAWQLFLFRRIVCWKSNSLYCKFAPGRGPASQWTWPDRGTGPWRKWNIPDPELWRSGLSEQTGSLSRFLGTDIPLYFQGIFGLLLRVYGLVRTLTGHGVGLVVRFLILQVSFVIWVIETRPKSALHVLDLKFPWNAHVFLVYLSQWISQCLSRQILEARSSPYGRSCPRTLVK